MVFGKRGEARVTSRVFVATSGDCRDGTASLRRLIRHEGGATGASATPGDDSMKNYALASGLALSAVVAVGLATVAFAERGPRGPMEMFEFSAVDADGDGKVTKAELEAHHKAKLAAADVNGDGKFSLDELAEMRLQSVKAQLRAKTEKMLKSHDTDGDGQLSAAEMPVPRHAGKFFDKVDTDGDGALSLAEVEAARARMQARHGIHGRSGGDDDNG